MVVKVNPLVHIYILIKENEKIWNKKIICLVIPKSSQGREELQGQDLGEKKRKYHGDKPRLWGYIFPRGKWQLERRLLRDWEAKQSIWQVHVQQGQNLDSRAH